VANTQTYEVSIPSVGLALMAAELATTREASCCFMRTFQGVYFTGRPRSDVEEDGAYNNFPASAEYYRIIDRIARGEKP
jgi:hypothetical protein